jgi:hypothetical protein
MLSAQDGFHSAQALPRGSSRHRALSTVRPAKSSVPRAPTNPLSTPVPRGIYSSRQRLLKRVKKSKKHSAGPPPRRPTAAGPPAPPPPRRRRHSRSRSATSSQRRHAHRRMRTAAIAGPPWPSATIHACSHSRHACRRTFEAAAARHQHGHPPLPRRIWRKRESN